MSLGEGVEGDRQMCMAGAWRNDNKLGGDSKRKSGDPWFPT